MTNKPITIRPLTEADLPTLQHLFWQIDKQHADALPHVFKPTETRSLDHLTKVNADPERFARVAEVNHQVCGFILCYFKEAGSFIHQQVRLVHVNELVVDTHFHGRGIAQALMTSVRQWADEKQATKIDLNVYSFNKRAIRFYEKEGFSTEKITMSIDLAE